MDEQPARQTSGNQPIRKAKAKKNLKNEDSLKNIWNNIKHSNIQIIGILHREERGTKTLLNNG